MPDARKPDLCIHHMPCADGFTAAWAVWRRWPDVAFHPGVYGAPSPDVTGKHVLIVDFSYKHPVLVAMAREAASITVLDHHKSAEADLAAFAVEELETPLALAERAALEGTLPIQALFDMDKSGARLAWEYCHVAPPPELVRYVEDRDLWRFDLPRTREIQATVFSHAYSFLTWDSIGRALETTEGRQLVIAEGEAIERKHHKDVAELLALCTREMVIGGFRVKVANVPYTLSSDAAGALAEGRPFGACYYDNAEGRRVFSLRSRSGGEDVSVIAAAYGGGGHAAAAGFTAPPGWEGDTPSPAAVETSDA